MVVASRKKKTGNVEMSKKSVLDHSCNGQGLKRERNYGVKVLTALPPSASTLVSRISDASALIAALEDQGLPPLDRQVAQKHLRGRSVTNWARHVLELLYLPEFLEMARNVDPMGVYLLETIPGTYNGVDVVTFSRLFVSFGAVKELVAATQILPFLALDGAHLRRVFGGIVLAAVIPSANRQLCCLAFAVVESETEETCAWFARLVLLQHPDVQFVWMTDQGVALTSKKVSAILKENGQYVSSCAKHMLVTLQNSKQRANGEIVGSLHALQKPIFDFSRARTQKAAEDVLTAISAKNQSVAKYLRERREKVAAFAILKIGEDGEIDGRRRGGRISNQLAESFNQMIMPFRQMGFVSGIVWFSELCVRQVQAQRLAAERWKSDNYRGDRVAALTPNQSKDFVAHELAKNVQYVVSAFQRRDALILIGTVVKVDDQSSCRVVEIRRAELNGKAAILCGCLTRQEFGYPCARAVKLMQTANMMRGTEGLWHWSAKENFAEFLWQETWEAQLQFEFPRLVLPLDLQHSQDVSSKEIKKKLSVMPKDAPIGPVPGKIVKSAGRPPESTRLTRRRIADHHARWKSAFEGSGKRLRKGSDAGNHY